MARKTTTSESTQAGSASGAGLAPGSDLLQAGSTTEAVLDPDLSLGSEAGAATDGASSGNADTTGSSPEPSGAPSQPQDGGEPGIGDPASDGADLAPTGGQESSGLDGGEPDASSEVQPPFNPNPSAVEIYPLRSYMDADELRRRGGPSYTVPRRHGEDLVQRKLASFEPLKE